MLRFRHTLRRRSFRSCAQRSLTHLGLVASEARPGGNVTGIEPYVAGLPAKQMEFAREIMPGASKIGLLTNLSDPKAPPQAQELLAAGQTLEIEVISSDALDLRRSRARCRRWQAGAWMS